MFAFCIEYHKQTYSIVTECFFFLNKKQNPNVLMFTVQNFKGEKEEMTFNKDLVYLKGRKIMKRHKQMVDIL